MMCILPPCISVLPVQVSWLPSTSHELTNSIREAPRPALPTCQTIWTEKATVAALSAWQHWRLGMRLITRGPNNKISLSFRVINRHSRRILASFVNGRGERSSERLGTRQEEQIMGVTQTSPTNQPYLLKNLAKFSSGSIFYIWVSGSCFL